MATISNPPAGVSPYQVSAAEPTVLRADATGATVTVTPTTATSTATGDTSVIVNGQAALNSLITTSRTGVFEGANVTINLEEQNFSTTNQVTATTNYPSGNTGEIQFNSGSNSFASNAYFTYDNSNVITPGIRTDGYFYSNGAPFIGGGNAAIGNFVFTGDTMTTSNPTLYITANGDSNSSVTSIKNVSNAGNSDILLNRAQVAITSGTSNTWTFGANGNLTLPSNSSSINYANGSPYGGGNYSNSNVSSFLAAFGSNVVLTTGNVTGGNLLFGTGIVSGTGNISGNYFIGNGSQLTGILSSLPLANGTSNINIATANGNVTITANGSPTWTFKSDGNLTLPEAGNIVGAVNIIGNGTGNVNVEANGRAWTFAADGNLVLPLAGNIVNYGNTWNFGLDGNLTLPANIIAINYANGNRVTGNITFRDEIVIGTGTSNLISGLYLAPSSSSADANMYLRVRGNINDEPTHIHFDTGNNQYYNQFIGDDNKYIQLANTGNIVINSNDGVGNSAQWNFGYNGILTLPGNSRVAPVGANIELQAAAGGYAEIVTSDGNSYVSVTTSGAQIVTSGVYTWTFSNSGNLILPNNGRIRSNNNEIVIATGNRADAYTESYQTANLWEVYSEDDTTAANHAYALISATLPTVETPQVYIENQKGSDGIPYRWTFSADGNTIFPGNLIGNGASPAPSINGFDTINAIDFSAIGNITGAYLFGNGSGLTGVGAASVPGQTILPTIQTITVAATSGVGNAGGAGSAFANVTVSNVTPVTEYGVIITSGTSSQKYATGALGSIPGTVQLTFSTGLNSTLFTVYAYVTSNAGTYYSNAATGTSGICLLAGTQIALSDGTHKAIEDITYTDKMLSWDFDRGCYAETTALWIKRSETGSQYNLLTFSDGTTLRTFDQHRIFNKQEGAFTYPMTDATPVGTITVNEHGQEITLTNKQVIKDTIEYYNVITDYHMNLFSDSVLTSCRFNNIYPIVDMKFAKDNRTLRTRAEFENVPDRFFHGLRLAEQTADIETVEWYVDRLLSTEVSTHAELAV